MLGIQVGNRVVNKLIYFMVTCIVSACGSPESVIIQPDIIETEAYKADIVNVVVQSNNKNYIYFDLHIINKLGVPLKFSLSDIYIVDENSRKRELHLHIYASYLDDKIKINGKEAAKLQLYFVADRKSQSFKFNGLSPP